MAHNYPTSMSGNGAGSVVRRVGFVQTPNPFDDDESILLPPRRLLYQLQSKDGRKVEKTSDHDEDGPDALNSHTKVESGGLCADEVAAPPVDPALLIFPRAP